MALVAPQELEHLGTTCGIADHDHDLVHELSRRGEVVQSALAESEARVRSLAVRKRPRSGAPDKLLDNQGISARAIVEQIFQLEIQTASNYATARG